MYDIFQHIDNIIKSHPIEFRARLDTKWSNLLQYLKKDAKSNPAVDTFLTMISIHAGFTYKKHITRKFLYFQLTSEKDAFQGSIVRIRSFYYSSLFAAPGSKEAKKTTFCFNTPSEYDETHLGPKSSQYFSIRPGMMYLPDYDGPTVYKKKSTSGKFENFSDMFGKIIENDDPVIVDDSKFGGLCFGVVNNIDPDLGVFVRIITGDSATRIIRVDNPRKIVTIDSETQSRAIMWKLSV